MDRLPRPVALALPLCLGLPLCAGLACQRAAARPEHRPVAHEAPEGTGGGRTLFDWPQGTVVLHTRDGRTHRVRVELALTGDEKARGLMHRESLPEGRGMLFIFPDEEVRTFWMKNTLIPLDMIFIRKDGTVAGIVHSAEPLTTTPRTVGKASKYVLEVPGGTCRAGGIDTGTTVTFEDIAPDLLAGRPLRR
ncbi:MAG: DUF192 domain-containing protein [Deltaproteobacteria bacterium]|nr:MAG: DUF192 domain-containing protein [Deltaproteobacteria bacterium]